MPHAQLTLKAETQLALNELWREGRLPFVLRVGKITKHLGYYTIHFHDSRIFTADVPLIPNTPYVDMVRAAVLARVAKLSGPLENWYLKTDVA